MAADIGTPVVNEGTSTATTITASSVVVTTTGNSIVVDVSWDSALAPTATVTVTDTSGHTYVSIDGAGPLNDSGNGQKTQRFIARNVGAGTITTVTATFSVGTDFRGIAAVESTGTSATPDDKFASQVQTNVGTGTDAATSGNTGTTTVANAVVYGLCGDFSGGGTPAVGTGFTSVATGWGWGGANLMRLEKKNVTAVGAQAATFTAATAGSDTSTFVVVLSEAGASTPTIPWLPRTPTPSLPPQAGPVAREVAPFSPVNPVPSLAWQPRIVPLPVVLAEPAPPAREVHPFAPMLPVPPMAWAPQGRSPPPAAFLPPPIAAAVSPLLPPSAPAVPPLSWLSILALLAVTLPQPPAEARLVEPLSPAFPVPALGWQPRIAPKVPDPVAGAPPSRTIYPFGPVLPVPALAWAPKLPLAQPLPPVPGQGRTFAPVTVPAPASFPLVRSGNNRYLVDQTGRKFDVRGATSWNLVGATVAGWKSYVDSMKALGYTSIELAACWRDTRSSSPAAPLDGSGNYPFNTQVGGGTYNNRTQNPDLTTPNTAFFNNLKAIVDYCEAQGILVQLFPLYTGSHHDDGWADQMVANSNAAMTSYGSFIGNLLKTNKNVVWMWGGDAGTGTDQYSATEAARLQAMIDAIAAVSGLQSVLCGAEWHQESIFDDQAGVANPLTFPAPFVPLQTFYSFLGDTATVGRLAYGAATTRPAVNQEGIFFGEGTTDTGDGAFGYNPSNATPPQRRSAWQALYGGGIAGRNDGFGGVWTFVDGTWQTYIGTAGMLEMQILNNHRDTIEWEEMVPQGLGSMANLVASGQGTGTQYVCAACGTSGKRMIVYRPPDHSGNFGLNLTPMQDFIRARWFNPSTGVYSTGGGAAGTYTLRNSATNQSFTPPGNNGTGFTDWVLELDSLDVPPLSWFPRGQAFVLPPPVVLTARQVAPFASSLPVTPLAWQPRGQAPPAAPGPAPEARVVVPLAGLGELGWLPALTGPLFPPALVAGPRAFAPVAPVTAAGAPPLAWLPSLAGIPLPAAFAPGIGEVGPFSSIVPVPALAWAPRLTPLPPPLAEPAPPARIVQPFPAAFPVPALSWLPKGIRPELVPEWPGVMRAEKPVITQAPVVVPPLAWLPVLAPTPPALVPGPQQNLLQPLPPAFPVVPLAWAGRGDLAPAAVPLAARARAFEPLAPGAALPGVQWQPVLAPGIADPAAAAALARGVAPILVPGGVPALAWAPSGSGAILLPVAAPGAARAVGPFAPAFPVPPLSWRPADMGPVVLPRVPAPPPPPKTEPLPPGFPVPLVAWTPRLLPTVPPPLDRGQFAPLVSPLLPPPPPPLPDLSWFPSLTWAPVLGLPAGQAQAIAPVLPPVVPPPLGILNRVALTFVASAVGSGRITADTIRGAPETILAEPYRGEMRVKTDVANPVTLFEGFPVGLVVVEGQGGQELLVHLSSEYGEDQVFPVSGAIVLLTPPGGPAVTKVAISGVGDVEYLVVRAIG